MILLPTPPRRAWLISFWLTLTMGSGLLIGIFFLLFLSPNWAFLAIIGIFATALIGVVRQRIVSSVYRFWNRLASHVCRLAQLIFSAICFFFIFAAVGLMGSKLQVTRPAVHRSQWRPRNTLSPCGYVHQYESLTEKSLRTGWIRNYLSWARHTGNLWAVPLLPFLILLRIVEPDKKTEFVSNIYTLF